MKKIGCLFVGFNTEEYVDQSIQPWINARADKLMGCEFVICAVSVPFLEYKDNPYRDSTQMALKDYYNNFKIDYLITEPEHVPEWVARDAAAQYLINQGVDILILVDSDEIWKESQIEEVLQKVYLDKFTSWFSLQYRNFVFDKETYLTEYFTPPRIFRVKTNGWTIQNCIYDNDFSYGTECFEFNKNCQKIVNYKELPTKLIRGPVIDHMSWISCENSKRKVKYQMDRWGVCSYKWNEIESKLEFNEEYYQKLGQKIPQTMKIIA